MKPIFEIEQFDIADCKKTLLSLKFGSKYCNFCITDIESQQLFYLCYLTMDKINAASLNEIFNHPKIDATNFSKVQISYDFNASTLISFRNFKHEDAGLILHTLYGVNATSAIISETIVDWQLYNVYAIPKILQESVSKNFPLANYWHQNTISIKQHTLMNADGRMIVDVKNDGVSVLVFVNGTILLAQTYSYATPLDVLFQLLNICHQFNLSSTLIQLEVSGLIDEQSALYIELLQYFNHISLRNANWQMNDSLPAHYFTSINDLAACAS